jgi:hypothetical protein
MGAEESRMEKALLVIVGLSLLGGSGFVLRKLAPRNGELAYAWLENDGAATAVSLGLLLAGTLGIGLLLQALAG